MSLNKLKNSNEFEQSPEFEKLEVEKKYVTADPNFFDFLKPKFEVQHIEQIYLSSPDEPYNLRVREVTYPDGTIRHTGALKTEGSLRQEGVARLETPATTISADTFAFYQQSDRPRLFKDRVEPMNGVSVDWIEGYPMPIIEIEDLATNEEGQLFLQQYADVLIDHSGMNDVDNEWIAHHLSNVEHVTEKQMTVEEMADKVLGYKHYGISPIVVTIDGRSGSGKTTYANQLAGLLKLGENGTGLKTVVLSTDNYHRGKTWLEAQNNGTPWQNWDDPIVYDTKELAIDVARLRIGEYIENRFFNFEDQECHYDGVVAPVDVIIIEGIHAGTKELEGLRHFHFPVVTPFATSVGRDLERLRISDRPNSTIGTTSERLGHQLEFAEPTFQKLERVSKRNLKAYRHKLGKKVVQVRKGELVSSKNLKRLDH
jgi:uridine kinase